MTNTKPVRRRHQGRIFPEFKISPEKLAKREDEKKTRLEKSWLIFNTVFHELIDEHYNWFITIEPNSGDYFVDPDIEIAEQKARQKYPTGWIATFRLNETGACDRI